MTFRSCHKIRWPAHYCRFTKHEFKFQNELVFKILFLLKHQLLWYHCWDYLTNFWCNNWGSIIDVVERLCLRAYCPNICIVWAASSLTLFIASWEACERWTVNVVSGSSASKALVLLFEGGAHWLFLLTLITVKQDWEFQLEIVGKI